jgi:hypothetical protein
MHFTILNLAGASAPFILVATLWGIWKEGRTRSLMLRMLPPERRPSIQFPTAIMVCARARDIIRPQTTFGPAVDAAGLSDGAVDGRHDARIRGEC